MDKKDEECVCMTERDGVVKSSSLKRSLKMLSAETGQKEELGHIFRTLSLLYIWGWWGVMILTSARLPLVYVYAFYQFLQSCGERETGGQRSLLPTTPPH